MMDAIRLWRKVRRGEVSFPKEVMGIIRGQAITDLVVMVSGTLILLGGIVFVVVILIPPLSSGNVYVVPLLAVGWAGSLIVFAGAGADTADCWYAFLRVCKLPYDGKGTPEYVGKLSPQLQTFLVRGLVSGLASKVIMMEQQHPGQEYHPDRVTAKAKFEQAYKDTVLSGFIEDTGYGEFFKK